MAPRLIRLAYVTAIPATQWAFLRGQNTYLKERGFELHAISSDGPELARLVERDGVIPHVVEIARRPAPVSDLKAILKLVRVFRSIQPDIVHLSTPKGAFVGAIAATLAGVPLKLFLMRGLVSSGARGSWRRVLEWTERLTARLCDVTVCNSPSLLADARGRGILGTNGGLVIGGGTSNGVDTDRFRPSGEGPAGQTIGFVGRLAREKGLAELVEAWLTLRTEFPESRLLLVGEWEPNDAAMAACRERLAGDDRVVVTGQVDETAPYYRRMAVFAFPSYREGFPNAPLEAAASGVSVVASRVVGCVDAVVDGVTGTLVPTRDSGALAGALGAYLRDRALGARHGAAGRERALREFRQERIWEGMAEVYARFTAGRLSRAVPAR